MKDSVLGFMIFIAGFFAGAFTLMIMLVVSNPIEGSIDGYIEQGVPASTQKSVLDTKAVRAD